jgi:hypothetical protein
MQCCFQEPKQQQLPISRRQRIALEEGATTAVWVATYLGDEPTGGFLQDEEQVEREFSTSFQEPVHTDTKIRSWVNVRPHAAFR